MLAEKLGLKQSGLSHLVSGRRGFPDPRRKGGRDFYRKLSRFVGGVSEDDLIDELYYSKKEQSPSRLEASAEFEELILNLEEHKEALPIVTDCLKSYVENVNSSF